MARLPIREAEIKALAQSIIAGLIANPGSFRTPPVSAVLQTKLDRCICLDDDGVARGAELPGQARNLEAPRQGEGWVFSTWEAPRDGGPIACYRIERRERPTGPWGDVGLSTKTEATLSNQERRKDCECRVIAVNKAEDGAPSNTVGVVV